MSEICWQFKLIYCHSELKIIFKLLTYLYKYSIIIVENSHERKIYFD